MQPNWVKQKYNTPLYNDVLWNKPINKQFMGKLLIMGGNLHKITAPSQAFILANKYEAGQMQVLMPNSTKKLIPKPAPPEIEFLPSTPSGSFAKEAEQDAMHYVLWADCTLFVGNFSHNSETGILLENLSKTTTLQCYVEDGIDYFVDNPLPIVNRNNTLLVVTMAQLQRIVKSLKLPTAVSLSMVSSQLVEVLQTITSKYPVAIIVYHKQNIFVGYKGQVSSTLLPSEPVDWRLSTATSASIWYMQQPNEPFKALTTAITQTKY